MEAVVVHSIPAAIVAGLLGGGALDTAMWLICRRGWAKGNMIIAVGSILTRKRENAAVAGFALHATSAIVFALVYVVAMRLLGLAHFPMSVFYGAGFGIVHGLIVSLMLVWVVAEEHPLDEFKEAGLAIGLSHFAGHIVYGAAVGLVAGLWPF